VAYEPNIADEIRERRAGTEIVGAIALKPEWPCALQARMIAGPPSRPPSGERPQVLHSRRHLPARVFTSRTASHVRAVHSSEDAMQKNAYVEEEDIRDDGKLTEATSATTDGLPNRLLTAFEVAEFVGCHEETVRRAYLRGLLTSQRFGVRGRRFHPADVLDWIKRGAPTRVS
jgi:excisionase family DNA binding protein